MKWICRRDRSNNTAIWIASMAVLFTSMGPTSQVHHGRSWLFGVATGVLVGVVVVALFAWRKRRCA
jgi:membrane protein DedA with SNARE-associated domain